MSLNETPSGERVQIGIFGRVNVGKSSLINAILNQPIAITSNVPGTTTDPVKKSMELLPLGPVTFIDTPGLDDFGTLGKERIDQGIKILDSCDIALLVVDEMELSSPFDCELLEKIKERDIPYLIVHNKADTYAKSMVSTSTDIYVSSKSHTNINLLRERISTLTPQENIEFPIVSDLVSPGDTVVLVVPIDKAAPKGRLILPQQQTIRELLEKGVFTVVVRETELKSYLDQSGSDPSLVITDSQVFKYVSSVVKEDVRLTSFSILMARHKGILSLAYEGSKAVNEIEDEDTILISEGCTHHRQCGDIGTQKLPALVRNFTGKNPNFIFTSGTNFPSESELLENKVKLVIHCGGCMLTEREMKRRYKSALNVNIPITNYGIAISHMRNILERCTFML